MALVTSRAIVLRGYRLGETSKVVVCYTEDYGKVRLVAKGVRKGGSRFGAALEPLMVSGVVFYLREGRDLSLVSQASVEREFPELRRDVVRMAMGAAVVELLERLLPDREPDRELYGLTERALEAMAEAPVATLDALLWRFILGVASRLGYRPELRFCVVCGTGGRGSVESGAKAPDGPQRGTRERVGWAGFSPDLGGLVCARCAATGGLALTLSTGPEAEILVALANGDQAAPDVAGRTLTPAARDAITRALALFIEQHAGHSMRLKSLDFLAQVRRLEEPTQADDQ